MSTLNINTKHGDNKTPICSIKHMQTQTIWLGRGSRDESINSLQCLAACSWSASSISVQLCGVLNYRQSRGLTLQINTNTPACLFPQTPQKYYRAYLRTEKKMWACFCSNVSISLLVI